MRRDPAVVRKGLETARVWRRAAATAAAILCAALAPALAAAADSEARTAYVAGQFKRYGLTPFGTKGFRQPVKFIEQRVIADKSSVALVDGPDAQPLVLGQDMILGAQVPQAARIEAPLVFIGYGPHIPQAGLDGFARQDLKGKIAVLIDGARDALPAAQTLAALERRGALGVITLLTPKSMDSPWDRKAVLASQPGVYLADRSLQETSRPLFTASVNPAQAEKLFAGSGHSFAEVLALAASAEPIRGFDLQLSLRAQVAAQTRALTSANILGVLPGSDPMLARQYVVVSAHVGRPGASGVMEDASGVSSVLEIARAMTAAGQRPGRSVLFAVFAGEDEGRLGSRAFLEHPALPRNGLVADLTMDMSAPQEPKQTVMIQGSEESSLGRDARAVAAAKGYQVTIDRNAFVHADPVSFVRAGVPALSLTFSAADLEGAVTFTAYIQALTRRIADQDAQPAWLPGSVFAPPAPRAQQELTVPIDLPVGRRPQANLPGYG